MKYSQSLRIVKWVMFLILNVLFSKSEATAITNPEWCDTTPSVAQVNKLTQFNFLKSGHNQSPSQVRFMFTFGSLETGIYADAHNYTVDYTPNQTGEFIAKIGWNACYRGGQCHSVTCSKTVTVKSTTPTIEITEPTSGNVTVPLGNAQNITFKATDEGNDLSHIVIFDNDLVHRVIDNGSTVSNDGPLYHPPVKRCNSTASTKSVLACTYTARSNQVIKDGFFARSYDTAGNVSEKSIIQKVSFVGPPAITSFSPSTETQLNDDNKLTITAIANDPDINSIDQQLQSIQLCYASTTNGACNQIKLCPVSGTSGECKQVNWFPVSSTGDTYIWAKATDKAGLIGQSTRVKVVVNQKPTVNLSIKKNNTNIDNAQTGMNVTITAQANDTDGSLNEYFICKVPKNTPRTCTGAAKLKTCALTNATCTLTMSFSSAGEFDIFARVKDNRLAQAEQGKVFQVYTGLGVQISPPAANTYIESGIPYNLEVNIQALANSLNGALSSVEIYNNGSLATTRNFNCVTGPFLLPINQTKTTHVSWTPGSINEYKVRAKAIDCNGRESSLSAEVSILVKPQIPKSAPQVKSITFSDDTQQNYKLEINSVTWATSYAWYEYKNGAETLIGTTTTQELNVSKNYNDNGNYTYCAQAINSEGKKGPIGQGSACKSTSVEVSLPSSPAISPIGLQQTGIYSLTWPANDDLTHHYILKGSPTSIAAANWQVLQNSNSLNFTQQNPQVGIYSYQIEACDAQNNCTPGQQLTINHLAPYIQDAIFTNTCGNNCLEISGLGFNRLSQVNVQIQNSTETVSYSGSQITYINSNLLRINTAERIKKGWQHGGLFIQVDNPVGNIQKANIIVTENVDNERVDMILHSPAMSDTGNIYVGVNNKIYSINASSGNINAGWPYIAGGDVVATPALAKDNNQQDLIYVGAKDHAIYAFQQAGGQPLWRTLTRGQVIAPAIIDESGLLYVGSMDKSLYAIDANYAEHITAINEGKISQYGNIQWQYPFPTGISQQATLYSNGKIYVTTEDEQVHIIDRVNLGNHALRWQDIDDSLINDQLTVQLIQGWQPQQEQVLELIPIARLFYGLLGRAPTERELTFFAYASLLTMPFDEIINAFLLSDGGQTNLPQTDTNQVFLNKLYQLLFGENLAIDNVAGKTKAQWLAELNNGLTRAQVIAALIKSNEYSELVDTVILSTIYYFYDDCQLVNGCEFHGDSDGDGHSDWIEIRNGFDPLDPTDPQIATPNLSVTARVLNKFTLQWSEVLAPAGFEVTYRLYQKEGEGQFELYESNITELSKTLTKNDSYYEYKVQACLSRNNQICGPLSSLVSVRISLATVASIPDAEIITNTRPETTDIVGQLMGQANVSGGSVNYSVPITVPPGRQGMQPVLSLQYNSAQGNGLAGMGWSLSGQSAISRCSANWTEDSKVDRVDLQNNDLLCLNGQKLVLVSGHYGELDSEYRTLHESFSKIILLGGDYSSTASYFEVNSKSGQVSYYGETDESILTPSGSTVPLTWSISKVYDNAETQNNMTYTYINNEGEQTLTDIYYTGQSDTVGNRRVQLSHEDREDVTFGYIAGGSVKTTQRLSAITTYVGGTKVFDYNLAYEASNSPITGHSRLASIEQCGFEGITEQCLPKKEFTYSGDVLTFDVITSTNEVFNGGFPWSVANQLLGDFNNDGITDFARYDTLHLMSFENDQYVIDKAIKTPFSTWDFDRREDSKQGQLDFNNDGQLDLIGINGSGNLSVAMLNANQDGFDEQDLGIEMTCASLSTFAYLYNGNTTLDKTTKYRNACRIEPISDGVGGYYLFHRSNLDDLYLSRIHSSCTDNLCSTSLIPGIDKTSPEVITKYHGAPTDYRFFDFDGDGDPDIARIEAINNELNSGMQLVWYRNDQTGHGPTASNNFVKVIKIIPNFTAEFAVGSGSHWIDANGDGLLDLLINNDDWYLLINQGGILATPVNTGIEKFYRSDLEEFISNKHYTGPEHTTHNSIRVLDFNGDGLQDFMFLDRASTHEGNPHQRDCLSDRTRSHCREGTGGESAGVNDFAISPLAFGRYSVYLSSLSSIGDVSFTKKKTEIQGSMNHLFPVDMNNDGSMDFIGAIWQDDHTTRDDLGSPTKTFFYLGKNDSKGIASDLMTLAQDDTAVDSFGQKDEFSYQAYSQQRGEISSVDNSDLAEKNYYRIPSTQMVAVQHSFKNNNAGVNTIDYVYGEPIYHQAGLGFLGFESISKIDNAQGTTSTATYLMDYPLNGKVANSTVIETVDGSILQSQSNIWCDITTTACDSNEPGVYFVHLEASESSAFDPGGNAIKTEKTTYNSFDDYGNLTQQTKVISDVTTTHTTVVDNNYKTADEVNWWLDKLDYSQVTKSVSYTNDRGIVAGTNGSKSQKRTVTWKNNNARQLATETLTASDTTLTTVSTYNSYDTYGNVTKVTRSGTAVDGSDYTDVQANQILEHNYANTSGYFVHWQKNGLWANNAVTSTWDNRFGKVLTQTDINSRTTTNHYDEFGRLKQVESSSAPTQDIIYQWCSSCASNSVYSVTTVQDGTPTVITAFNRFGKTLKNTVTSFQNNVSANQKTIESFAYDALGRLTTHTMPHFYGEIASTETLSGYDVLNRATIKTVNNFPQSYTTTYTFTGLDTSISVNASNDGTLTMSRTYNALNQLISSTDANSNSTYFHYDANGNAIVIKDVLDNVISANYDGFNNKQWFDDPNLGRRDFRYNGLGQLRWQNDANSDEIRFDYDSLGRQTKRYVNNSTHATWTYDTRKKGVLSTLGGTDVNKNYFYDTELRVTKETSEIHNQVITRKFDIKYAYDTHYGRVKGIGYPSGEVLAYQYDQYGYALNDVNHNDNSIYRTVNSLNAQGKISNQQLGNGLYSITQFARSGEMTRVCVTNGTSCGNSLDDIHYALYDNFGNLKTVNNVVNDITETFVYDNLHRLDSATRTAGGIVSPEFTPTATVDYDYDAAGNLLLKGDYASNYNYVGSSTSKGGPNAVKSVTKNNGSQVSFSYDNNGNLTSGDGLGITYNHFNKPINIIRNNVTLAFTYGGDEQRALQVATHANKTVTTYYVGKLFEQVETATNDNTSIEQRHYLGDYAILTHSDEGSKLSYLHRDRLGSVSMISDGDKHVNNVTAVETLVLERKGYDAFGKPRDLYWGDSLGGILASSITNRGFTDHEHLDSAQLIHMNGRGYDYNLGRFLSVDPFIQFPESSQSVNPYSYLMNNPLAGTDPSGYSSRFFNSDGWRENYNGGDWKSATSEQPKSQSNDKGATVAVGQTTVTNKPDVKDSTSGGKSGNRTPPHRSKSSDFPLEGAGVNPSVVADFTPVVGDIKGIVEAITDPSAINISAAVIGIIIPFGGDAAAAALKGTKNIRNGNGAARAGKHSANWASGSLGETVEKFAGANAVISTTASGKKIFTNPSTGIQVVQDLNGSYFRVYDPSISGKRAYLDLSGNVPNNKILSNGKQTGRSQGEYNQATHFNILE